MTVIMPQRPSLRHPFSFSFPIFILIDDSCLKTVRFNFFFTMAWSGWKSWFFPYSHYDEKVDSFAILLCFFIKLISHHFFFSLSVFPALFYPTRPSLTRLINTLGHIGSTHWILQKNVIHQVDTTSTTATRTTTAYPQCLTTTTTAKSSHFQNLVSDYLFCLID